MANKFMGEVFLSNDYVINNPSWHIEDSSWKAKQILKIIDRNNLKPNHVCEVGCGAGEILRQLYLNMSNHITFYGYEISSKAFELCQLRKQDRLNFHLKDINIEQQTFDLLLCIDVFEHIPDYLTFIQNLKSKGQYKIFHIPLDMSVLNILKISRILYKRRTIGHLHYFTKEIALDVLKDAGYEIIDYFYTCFSIDLPGEEVSFHPKQILYALAYMINQDMAVKLIGGSSLLVLTR
jgi:SAM-dependent methyltransferase